MPNSVVDLPAYELARSLAATAVLSGDDRNFLPLISAINRIAFQTGTYDPYYNLVIELAENSDVTTGYQNLVGSCELTRQLLEKMSNDYVGSLKNYCLNYAPGKIPCKHQAIAVSTIPSCPEYYVERELAEELTVIKISGNAMSPAINNNQLIQVAAKCSTDNFFPLRPLPAIVQINTDNTENLTQNSKSSLLICRYTYNTGDQLLLTAADQQQPPYAIHYPNVLAIYPVSSVLWA